MLSVVRVRLTRVGLAAAAAVCTIKTSRIPPSTVAVTDRSTPGRADGYRAVAPDTVGAGRVIGSDMDNTWPARSSNVASGPDPPPDKWSAPTAAAGDHVPSALAVSVAFTGVHRPPSCTRCGSSELVKVKDPSGLATVWANTVVS